MGDSVGNDRRTGHWIGVDAHRVASDRAAAIAERRRPGDSDRTGSPGGGDRRGRTGSIGEGGGVDGRRLRGVGGERGGGHDRDGVIATGHTGEWVRERGGRDVMTVGRVEAHRVAGDVRTAVVGGRRPVGGDGVLARCRREVGRCTRGAHHRSHTRGLGGGGCVGGELGDGHDRDDVIDTGGDPGEGVGERRCIDIDTGGRVETHGVGRDVRATISSRRCPLDLDRPLTRRRRKIRRRTRRDDLGRRVSEFGCRRRVCRELRLRDHRHRMIDTRRDTGELIRERRRIHVMTIRRIETHRVAGDIGTAISGRSRPRDRDRTIARNGERTRRCVRSDDEGAHRRRLSGDRRVSRELRGGRDRHRMIDTRRDTGELIR